MVGELGSLPEILDGDEEPLLTEDEFRQEYLDRVVIAADGTTIYPAETD